MAFELAYVIGNIIGAAVNEESANFGMIAVTIGSPLAALFWISVPSLNPDNSKTPLWSVIPAMALLIAGSICWKLWERREKARVGAVSAKI